MSNIRIVPWHTVTDEMVISWSVMELIYNSYYEILGNATRVFSKGYALADGGYGWFDSRQRETLDAVKPHVDSIMDAAHRMTLWIDSKQGNQTRMNRDVGDQDQILLWSPEDLLKETYTSISVDLVRLFPITSDLISRDKDYADDNQEKMIKLLIRDIKRVENVTERIGLWLSSNLNYKI
jgi:hypothetical protein